MLELYFLNSQKPYQSFQHLLFSISHSQKFYLSEYNSPKDLLTSLEAATGLDPATFEGQWLEAIQNSS